VKRGGRVAAARTHQEPPRTVPFYSNRAGGYEIYVSDDDESAAVRLTDSFVDDVNPFSSPDGRSVSLGSDRSGNQDVYSVSVDGLGVTRLTDDPALDFGGSWGRQPAGR
jgi:Tol biopolymer transport system component